MRKLIVSNRAEHDLNQIEEYIEVRWSVRVAKKFTLQLERVFSQIKANPEMFVYSHQHKLYKALVNKRTILFYRFNHAQIEIARAFDARVNYEDEEKWK